MRLTLLAALLLMCATALAQPPSPKEQADKLISDIWEYNLKRSPEFATYVGDHRCDDQVSDLSPEAIRADEAATRDFLKRANAIAVDKLDDQQQITIQLLRRRLQNSLEEATLEPWLMPVSQFDGPHTSYAELAKNTVFRNAQDYSNYIARLHRIPKVFAQYTSWMREGMKRGLMPPAYLLPEVARQTRQIADMKGDASPFAGPLKEFPAAVNDADRKRISSEVLNAVNTEIVPAYEKFATFLANEYAPKGRKAPGIWSVPQGDKRYALSVREMTTTNMAPQEVHQLGLAEIDRVEKEMLAIAKQMGYKDLASFHEAIKNNKKLYGSSGEQIKDLYQQHLDEISKDLPKYFGHLPKAPLTVIPMSAYRAGASVPADYSPGTPDGSRPGHVNVNMTDPEHRLLLNLEAIAYHEGVPGHHLQFSIAQELQGLPPLRKHMDFNAYSEGWALYAERLAHEMGYYKDPYSEYGRLENEMWRAIRLVVDTGVHQMQWSRQQMVDYFHKYTAMDEPNIQTEVDRYIAWPGQALAYKVGQMTILHLRAKAEQQLGPKFDIRAFHDEVLGAGPLPMDVLEQRINRWIEANTAKH